MRRVDCNRKRCNSCVAHKRGSPSNLSKSRCLKTVIGNYILLCIPMNLLNLHIPGCNNKSSSLCNNGSLQHYRLVVLHIPGCDNKSSSLCNNGSLQHYVNHIS